MAGKNIYRLQFLECFGYSSIKFPWSSFMKQDVRWKQRFQNFEKAFLFLSKATKRRSLDDLQAAGLIQSFEFTFELAWKTLKDYLEMMGVSLPYPRLVIKHAYKTELIEDGTLWLEMLEKKK